MKRLNLILLTLLIAVQAYAGPYSDQLRTDSPQTGRFITEDGNVINIADFVQRLPLTTARIQTPGAYPFGTYGLIVTTGAVVKTPVADFVTLEKLPNLGVSMSVVSTSANDTVGGSGINSVEIHYIDRAYNPGVEVVNLNGTTNVPMAANDIIWVQDTHVATVGTPSNPAAAGNITVEYNGNAYSGIAAGNVRSESSFRMIPKDKYYFLEGVVASSVSTTSDTSVEFYLVASEHLENTFRDPLILIPQAAVGVQNGTFAIDFPHDFRFSEGVVIGILATSNKAATVTGAIIGRMEPVE